MNDFDNIKNPKEPGHVNTNILIDGSWHELEWTNRTGTYSAEGLKDYEIVNVGNAKWRLTHSLESLVWWDDARANAAIKPKIVTLIDKLGTSVALSEYQESYQGDYGVLPESIAASPEVRFETKWSYDGIKYAWKGKNYVIIDPSDKAWFYDGNGKDRSLKKSSFIVTYSKSRVKVPLDLYDGYHKDNLDNGNDWWKAIDGFFKNPNTVNKNPYAADASRMQAINEQTKKRYEESEWAKQNIPVWTYNTDPTDIMSRPQVNLELESVLLQDQKEITKLEWFSSMVRTALYKVRLSNWWFGYFLIVEPTSSRKLYCYPVIYPLPNKYTWVELKLTDIIEKKSLTWAPKTDMFTIPPIPTGALSFDQALYAVAEKVLTAEKPLERPPLLNDFISGDYVDFPKKIVIVDLDKKGEWKFPSDDKNQTIVCRYKNRFINEDAYGRIYPRKDIGTKEGGKGLRNVLSKAILKVWTFSPWPIWKEFEGKMEDLNAQIQSLELVEEKEAASFLEDSPSEDSPLRTRLLLYKVTLNSGKVWHILLVENEWVGILKAYPIPVAIKNPAISDDPNEVGSLLLRAATNKWWLTIPYLNPKPEIIPTWFTNKREAKGVSFDFALYTVIKALWSQ